MRLIERETFISQLGNLFQNTLAGEGHTVFVSGEAGMGKTSLVKEFCRTIKDECSIYTGTCDALFTPRPLAPLYDIAWQMLGDHTLTYDEVGKRADLFTRFYQQLAAKKEKTVIIFEDVHWADEATFDFIKFLARRITSLQCLFIITHRDDECQSTQLLRSVMGQLAPGTFTRMQLTPLSKEAVEKLAKEKGYNGTDVYRISGGNPFYVTEIIASYSPGIPVSIKDSIISIYNRTENLLRKLWDILCILPSGFELNYMEQMESSYLSAFESCIDAGLLVIKEQRILFKHELYRRTIEESMSPLKRVALNKKILELFLPQFEKNKETERIVHHAKNANEYELVVKYAPIAAKKAAALGAHIEATKLYLAALEYYQQKDKDVLVLLYEQYAYECYLTNQIKEAIIYTGYAYAIWKEKEDVVQIGNSLRFLSRLWWFEGNRKQAEHYAKEAISVLNKESPSFVKAMAFSNMSQLKMLEDNAKKCIFWGEQAIAMATELNNEEILSHALNNVGTVHMIDASTREIGRGLLEKSLAIALKNDYQEHAARAYTNLGSAGTKYKEYPFAIKILEEGIRYTEDRDLNSWTAYMLSWLARVQFETGNWDAAYSIAVNLLKNEKQPSIIKITVLTIAALIKMRRGETDVYAYLDEAKTKSLETLEIQRIQPAITALLEYEWINGKEVAAKNELKMITELIFEKANQIEKSEFAFWLQKARNEILPGIEWHEGYRFQNSAAVKKSAAYWKQLGCSYQQAMLLFEGTETDKKEALIMIQKSGAEAVYNKMKQQMRNSGIKSIPRGIRKSTLANPAHLTDREVSILQQLKKGLQNKEIADTLFISPKTVDHHISSIYFKLDVNSRSKAAEKAVQLGIIK